MRTTKKAAGHYVSSDGRFEFTRMFQRHGDTWRVEDTTGATPFIRAGRARSGIVCDTLADAKQEAQYATEAEQTT